MRLGVLVAVRSLEDAEVRLDQARAAGFSLCQLNLQRFGCERTALIALADRMLERDMRAVAIGCYVNPLRPDEPSPLGATRADLDQLDPGQAAGIEVSHKRLHAFRPRVGDDITVDCLRREQAVGKVAHLAQDLILAPDAVHLGVKRIFGRSRRRQQRHRLQPIRKGLEIELLGRLIY